MEQSQIEAINRQIAQSRWVAEHERTARPVGVTLIAGFQFLKTAVLLLTAALLRFSPETVNAPNSPLYSLLYVATRGKLDSTNPALHAGSDFIGLVLCLILILALYFGAIGFGMLSISAWARRTLIFNTGLTLALWAKATLWPDPAAIASPNMTNFYVLLAIDAMVFLYLLRGNTKEFFAARN